MASMKELKAREQYLVGLGEIRQATASKPSASKIYRLAISKDGFPANEHNTLHELFQQSVAKYSKEPLLGWRPIDEQGKPGAYQWMTYAETAERVNEVASGLAGLGLTAGNRVGVYGVNCPEWMLAMQACNRMSYQCVPLYDTLGENAVEYIINHSESVLAFADSKKLGSMSKALKGVDSARFTTVIYWGKEDPAAVQACKVLGLKVMSMDELREAGRAKPAEAVPPKPDDYSTIMYTSGTTGDPKGVLLKHSAICSTVTSLKQFLEAGNFHLGPGDSVLSYLPLAHIFDRTCEESMISLGCKIGYWQGNVNVLVEDIGALKPSLFIGVPRVFDRIYSRVIDQVNEAGGIKKVLFNYAMARKLFFLRKGYNQDKAAPFFDRLVFKKVKQRLGGNVKLLVSGGAPLAPHVEDFLKVAMCAPVVQGYGLTETCAASCIAVPDDYSLHGTNGPVQPATEIRLESVPEMDYNAATEDEPAGEVLLRGPQLFSGYYKQDDKTAEVLDDEGWFHTGDIGVLTKAGGLKIVDRKKNIFKLSQGEYIAVEKLEGIYKKAPSVEQVWVYGNSFKSSLVAVVVPKPEAIKAWAAANGKTGSVSELCKDPAAAAWMLAELNTVGKENKVKGFEAVRAVHLDEEQFSVENECMTPTFKFKRPQLQKRYQSVIDTMYVQVEADEQKRAQQQKQKPAPAPASAPSGAAAGPALATA